MRNLSEEEVTQETIIRCQVDTGIGAVGSIGSVGGAAASAGKWVGRSLY